MKRITTTIDSEEALVKLVRDIYEATGVLVACYGTCREPRPELVVGYRMMKLLAVPRLVGDELWVATSATVMPMAEWAAQLM
jgi:hypothetical protein